MIRRFALPLAVAAVLFGGATPAAAQHAPHQVQPAKPQPSQPDPKKPQEKPKPADDHSAHTNSEQKTGKQIPKEPIPPITDADRAAAFPSGLHGHATHDRAINFMVRFDQLEWQGGGNGGATWDNSTWIGGDRNRLWVRTEGEADAGRLEQASADVLWGRMFSRWWDVVAGVRQDFRPGDPQTWVGGGVQGLAPYWFEIEATGYIGAGGRTRAQIEAEYELLLTNRLILQPLIEVEVFGKSDPERGIGAGLSTIETGLRLRYEIRREFAPYVGVDWSKRFFGTADSARRAGEDVSGARVAFGLRAWF